MTIAAGNTTADKLLSRAHASFDGLLAQATYLTELAPPSDGIWRRDRHGGVQVVLIAAQGEIVELKRFPNTFVVWYDAIDTMLKLELLPDGEMRACTDWAGPEVPLKDVPQKLLDRVGGIIPQS